jgi:hypothetical protein
LGRNLGSLDQRFRSGPPPVSRGLLETGAEGRGQRRLRTEKQASRGHCPSLPPHHIDLPGPSEEPWRAREKYDSLGKALTHTGAGAQGAVLRGEISDRKRGHRLSIPC